MQTDQKVGLKPFILKVHGHGANNYTTILSQKQEMGQGYSRYLVIMWTTDQKMNVSNCCTTKLPQCPFETKLPRCTIRWVDGDKFACKHKLVAKPSAQHRYSSGQYALSRFVVLDYPQPWFPFKPPPHLPMEKWRPRTFIDSGRKPSEARPNF